MICETCDSTGVVPCPDCDGDEFVTVDFRGPCAVDELATYVEALDLWDEPDPIGHIEDTMHAVVEITETAITITIPCEECGGEGHLGDCTDCNTEWVIQPSEWAEARAEPRPF